MAAHLIVWLDVELFQDLTVEWALSRAKKEAQLLFLELAVG